MENNENFQEFQNNGENQKGSYNSNSEVNGRRECKKSGFGKGLLTGVIVGVISTFVVANLIVFIHGSLTGEYIVLGRHGVSSNKSCKVLDDEAVDKIEELSNYMDLYYYEDIDDDKLKDSMYAGVLAGLNDPYSVYYTPKEYAELQVSTNGNYYGIGAGLTQDEKTKEVSITKIYEGTPSEDAGLLKGDTILDVDGNDPTSMELTELVQIIRGEEGSKVHIKVYRRSTKEKLEFDVERKNVELPSVSGKMLDNKMGYIQISEFQKNTAKQFSKALKKLEKDGMKGLIVDVRSNPGGLVTSVVSILDELLPKGTVVYTQDKYGNRQDYTSEPSCVDFPIVVLIDENSASASEIFAGAIKDYKAGTLVGTKSFGKGIVQSIFPLEDGDAVKITTAKYFTPNGNYIHGKGIEPDEKIEYNYSGPKDKEYNMKYDNQLQKAIEVLGEKIK